MAKNKDQIKLRLMIYMAYLCIHCGKEIKSLERNNIRCPYCGYRVVSKKRSSMAREVKTD